MLLVAAAPVGVYAQQRLSHPHSIEIIIGLAVVIVAIWADLAVQLHLRRLGAWRSNGAILGSQPMSVMRMIQQLPAGNVKRRLLTLHLLSLGAIFLVMLLSFSWVSG